jgi:hypothetical protein
LVLPGAVAAEGEKKILTYRRLELLRKKKQRILIMGRKISVLRVDAVYSIQALFCQKEKTISALSAC